MFNRTSLPVSVLNFAKRVMSGKIRFDLEVQRRSVWTEKQKQDLVDSLIFNYPVPPCFFVSKGDDFQWTLDGQQRSLAISSFYNDEFALDLFVPQFKDEDGKVYDVAGKKYSELDESVKIHLNAVNIDTYTFNNISEEEVTTMFARLNAGTPFKTIEITRINMPTVLTAFVNEISRDSFFANKVAISDKSRIHFADQELILQTMMMFFGEDTGFSGKEIQGYTLCTELDDDEKLRFMMVLEYVNKVFLDKTKYLKKANVSVIFKVAEMAMDNDVDPKDFLVFVNDFFASQKSGTAYGKTLSAGSAKKENVQQRLAILTKAFEKGIEGAKLKRIELDKEKAIAEAKEVAEAKVKASIVELSTEIVSTHNTDMDSDALAQQIIDDLNDLEELTSEV